MKLDYVRIEDHTSLSQNVDLFVILLRCELSDLPLHLLVDLRLEIVWDLSAAVHAFAPLLEELAHADEAERVAAGERAGLNHCREADHALRLHERLGTWRFAGRRHAFRRLHLDLLFFFLARIILLSELLVIILLDFFFILESIVIFMPVGFIVLRSGLALIASFVAVV